MRNDEIRQLRKDIDDLNERVDDLIDELVRSEVVSRFSSISSNRKYTIYNIEAKKEFKHIKAGLLAIVNHLGLELKWVECKPHYELKEKKEEE